MSSRCAPRAGAAVVRVGGGVGVWSLAVSHRGEEVGGFAVADEDQVDEVLVEDAAGGSGQRRGAHG
ncbi:hypothetical protein [Streptomyces platensis]|nr:hypothetical protein [Streptomyces platensis]